MYMKKYILSSIILLLAAANTAWGQNVATVNGTGYTTLADALNAAREAAAGGWNTTTVTVEILEDITFSSTDTWTPIVYNQLNPITINGNNHTITNLPGMLYAKSGSGVSTLTINNLTFESPTVSLTTDYAAVIMGYADCVQGLYFNNVTINNATVTGANYVAAFVGYAAGYNNANDGPVYQHVVFNNCQVTNSTLTSTGGGSVGALMGHASGNVYGQIEVEGTTVSGNTITTSGTNKAGALFGTVGAAGATNDHPEAGLYVSANVSGNTVTANNTAITTIYGRQGTSSGRLTLTEGGSYDAAPIATSDASWATTEDGVELTENSDGTFTVAEPVVAKIGDTTYPTLQAALDAAEAADPENIVIDLVDDATLDITAWNGTSNSLSIGTVNTKTITINGNSHTLTFNHKNSDWNNVATMNDAQTKLILNDMTITNSGYNNGPWNRHDINFNCAVELNNVTSDKALAFKNAATLNNVTITESSEVYAIWIQPNGQDISIDGLTINNNTNNGRGIKIDEQYVSEPAHVDLEIANATFNTAKKSAILVKTAGGATITAGENIDISNVAADNDNLVWVDEASAEEYYNVTVEGTATMVPEGTETSYVASLERGNQVRGYYATLAAAYESTDYAEGDVYRLHKNTTEAVEIGKALTIYKNGFTAGNVTAAVGFVKTETDTEIQIQTAVAKIGDDYYTTLKAALDVANAASTATTITLLADVDMTDGSNYDTNSSFGRIPISKSMTIDGAGYTITVKNRGFGVGMNASSNIDVTFQNVTIQNSANAGRCIDTRGNIGTLTINNSTLKTDGATSGYTQPLTIGGSQSSPATVNITNSTIQTNEDGTAYYAIITFNPVNMIISESTIKGWACIYAKAPDSSAGSAGSVFTVDHSTLVSSNAYSGVSNSFGAIVLEDNDVTVNVTNTNITLNNTGDQTQAIVSSTANITGSVTLGEGNNVTFVEPGNFAFSINDNDKLEVSGGTFNVPVPEEYCAEGYIPTDADPETGLYTVKSGAYVAEVYNSEYESIGKYETFADAWALANATEGSTLMMLEPYDTTSQLEASGTFTLDFNGNQLQYIGTSELKSGVIMVLRGANLTIDDTDSGLGGIVSDVIGYYTDSEDPDAMIQEDIEEWLGCTPSHAYAAIALTKNGETSTDDAVLTVNGGELYGHYYGISGNGSRNGTDITVTGGTITGAEGTAIYQPQDGTLTISGGSFMGGETGIEVRSGTLIVTGGTFETTATTYSCYPNGSGTTTVGAAIAIAQHTTNQPISASITGGTFETPDGGNAVPLSIQNPQNNTFDNVTVSSAILELVQGSEIPEGYCWASDGDGTYSLVKGKLKIAKTVGDETTYTYYPSLETAVAAVANGETITLLENVTMADHAIATLTDGQSFLLDLDSYNVTNVNGDNTYSVKLAKGVMAKTSKAADIFNVKDDVEDATIVSGVTHAQTGHRAYYAATTMTNVPYINEDGEQATTDADTYVIVIDERMDAIQTLDQGGWFYVNSDVALSNLKAIGTGAVNLILGDGKTLAHSNANGLTVNNLTVFGQAEQSGKMTLTSTLGKNDANAIITINGGIVIINSGDEGTAMKAGKIYVNAGQVEAHGAHGMVEVTGSTIELGLRDPEQYPDDYIIADTYEGTVVIADGQTLYDSDDNYRPYTGTLTDAQKAAIAGHKLVRATNVFAAQRIVNDEVVANYETLKEAFDDVQDGETIKLLRNVHLNDAGVGSSDGNNFTCPLESGTINLDYNSKNLTGSNRFIRLHTGIKVITNKVYNNDQSRPTYFINADANSIAIAGLIDETDKYFQVTVLPLTADVPYVDENGDDQTTYAAPLTSDLGTTVFLGSGSANTTTWYYLPEDASFKRLLYTLNNTASLILTDGKTMTVSGGPIEGTNSTKGNLVIYGQTEQTGALNMSWQGNQTACMLTYTQNGGNVSSTGSFNINTITINDGNLSVTGNGGGYAPLGRLADNSSVTINGGTVEVKRTAKTGANENAINANNITITGGELTAESTNTAIYAQNNITITGGKTTVKSNEDDNNYGFRAGGTITMSLSKNDEYINSINGKYRANTIVIPYGLYAQGEGEKYIGVVSADDINNKKLVLQPYEAVIDFGGDKGEVFYLTLAEADKHDENGTYIIRLLHNIESPYVMGASPDSIMKINRNGRYLQIAAPRGYVVKAESEYDVPQVIDGENVNCTITTYTSIPVNMVIATATYNALPQLPQVTVTDIKNNVELVLNTDFKVTTVAEDAADPVVVDPNDPNPTPAPTPTPGYTDAGTYVDAIRIQGIVDPEDTQENGYIADIYSNFTIEPLNLTDYVVSATAPYEANGYGADNSESGAAVKAAATVTIKNGNGQNISDELKAVLDITIDNDPTAANNYNNTGTYLGVVHATPMVDNSDPNNVIDYGPNFSGSIAAGNLVIGDGIDITNSLVVTTPNAIYTGAALPPSENNMIVKVGDQTLTYGTHYTFTYNGVEGDYVDAKTYRNAITITGLGTYAGTFKTDYVIAPRDLSDTGVTVTATELAYNTEEQYVVVTVKYGNNTIPAENYTFDPTKVTEAGLYDVTVTAVENSNLVGSRTVVLKVTKALDGQYASDFTVSPDPIPTQTETGNEIKPVIVVKDKDRVMTLGVDYTVAYTNNINAGTATITITGAGAYSGIKTINFTIVTAYFTENGITYHHANEGEEISVGNTGKTLAVDINTTGNPVTVPQTVTHDNKTYTVTGVEQNAFGSDAITGIVLPASIEEVENGAFNGANNLRYVDLSTATGFEPSSLQRNIAASPFNGVPKQALVFLNGTNFTGENYVYNPGSGNQYYCEVFKIYDDLSGAQTGFGGDDYKWAFENPHEFTAYSVENTRQLTAERHYTICLPYALEIPNNVKAYTLEATSNKPFGFTEVTGTLSAYTPYVLIPTKSGQLLGTNNNTVIPAFQPATVAAETQLNGKAGGDFTMYGTMRYMDGDDATGKYIMQYNNGNPTWKKITDSAAGFTSENKACILPMRAYIMGNTSGSREFFDVVFTNIDGTTLTFDKVTFDDDAIYDLSGRRVELLEHGHTYIINGKKVIVK